MGMKDSKKEGRKEEGNNTHPVTLSHTRKDNNNKRLELLAYILNMILLALVTLLAYVSASSGAASPRTFDVTAFGAVGNGVADDTAFQRTFGALGNEAGRVHVPIGSFRITATVHISSPGMFSFVGDGPGSVILWTANADLLAFEAKGLWPWLLFQTSLWCR